MKHIEHNSRVSLGLFFIIFGLLLLVAMNDFLDLGSIKEYFTWQIALIFIGILLVVNFRFVGGILFMSFGTWFFLEKIYFEIPHMVKIIYWPSVIILIGLSFIISSLLAGRK